MNTPVTSFSITIPKPCHEDWNKMTPDEKGAFCGSCQKSVYDFSGKTDEEVAEILMANQGRKICGRFDAKQLDRPVDVAVPVYNIPTVMSPVRAFAMALFLVFGSFLFNCSTASGQKMGKIKLVETETVAPTTQEEPKTTIQGQTKIEQPKVMGGPKYTPTLKGDVKVKPVQDSSKTTTKHPVTQTPPPQKREYYELGEVCVRPKGEIEVKTVETPKDTAKPHTKTPPVTIPQDTVKEILMGKVSITSVAPIEDPLVDKMPVITPIPVEPIVTAPVDTITVKVPENMIQPVSSTKLVPLTPDKKAVTIEVMPNPSKGQLNLRYSIKEKNITLIELYDINGTRVKTFVNSQLLYEGTYATCYDISDLPDGIYICTLRSGDKTASTKVILTK